MSAPADEVDGMTDEIAGGVVVEFEPVGGGKIRLRSRYEGDVLERGEYAEVFRDSHRGRTNRGQFINNTTEAVESVEGLDAAEIKTALRAWFTEMAEIAEEEELAFQPDHIQEIVRGT